MKRAALHNLGCKVNAYETEAMQELLEAAGYEICPFHEKADVYIINTCTVTNMADRKSRQMIHRARKNNPDAVIAAAGCYVQVSDTSELDPCIDVVIGNNQKKDLVAILDEHLSQKDKTVHVLDIGHTREYEELKMTKTAEHTRAYLKVQDGCNQFCTYCIIPYARGRVRSRKLEDVVSEVQTLAERGYKEVVLTGIHLSSYGVDQETDVDLLALIQAVHEVDGIRRIRLGSLEPGIITEEFAEAISKMDKFCPHFHLSLQSGCNATLKRMNRKYTAEEYAEKCALLRKYFDHPALTTDVIVGFPGETEEEFRASMDFVDGIGFYETHIFKYSKRKGTIAAGMPDQIPEQEKTKRSAIMLELDERHRKEYESHLIGKQVEVLFEESEEHDGEVWQIGHTKEYVKIAEKTEENYRNQIRIVDVTDHLKIMH
jgi:threonylcarbamoyladenosine tRNA methylthiotransferase MtaB